jgi:hypothetical protein
MVQVNPARRRSTLAKTDAQSVAARRCFLCAENMPTEERGVAFEDLVIMPNPFPVLPMHCTIASREHRPQLIAGRIDCLLRLAKEIRPELAAFYNGPQCGASAPDHFHFQAARASEIPILSQLPMIPEGNTAFSHSTFGRQMLIARGSDIRDIQLAVEKAIHALQELTQSPAEPMLNVLAHHGQSGYTVIVFPRRAHRPACYFAAGPEQLLVSPAVLEMCGILVATQAEQLERIDADVARTIYQEVSIGNSDFEQLVGRLGQSA